MSFITFGYSAIKADHVAHATWQADQQNPLVGTLVICTSSKGFALSFDHPDVEKAAKAVGLADFWEEWHGKVKEVEKAKVLAQARIDAKAHAEEAAAKAHAEEVAKHEARLMAEAAKEAAKTVKADAHK